jgi:hypothetical protein
MKTKLLALALLAGGSLFAAPHVSVGIGIGVPGYYAPPAVAYAPAPVVVRPPYPGPDYNWVNGYWSSGVWIGGYWAPPYRGRYVAPRYYGPGYYSPRYYGARRDWDRGRGWRR